MKATKLILLRKVKYGEADLILSGITCEGSKLSFVARSAVKSRKRFGGGVLEPTHYVRATYKESRSESGLNSLSEASLLESFAGLKKDFSRIEMGLKMVRMIDRLSQDGDQDLKNLFDLLGNSLKAAETSQNLEKLQIHFEVKLMTYLGILPQWSEVRPFLNQNIDQHQTVETSLSDVGAFSEKVHRYFEEHLNVRL